MIVQILKHTPPWVFALFFVLIYLGYGYSRARTVPAGRLFALPLAMVGLSFYGVGSAFGFLPLGFAAWGLGMMLALLLNRALRLPRGVAHMPAEKAYRIPGSWLPLGLMMAIFFTKYAVAVVLARQPALAGVAPFVAPVTGAYGFLSGLFLALTLHVRRAAAFPSTGEGTQLTLEREGRI